MAFSLFTHIRNTKGQITHKNPYRLRIIEGRQVFERNGEFFNPDGSPANDYMLSRQKSVDAHAVTEMLKAGGSVATPVSPSQDAAPAPTKSYFTAKS